MLYMYYYAGCSRQKDLTFLVDISGSLEQGYDIQQTFCEKMVQGLDFKYGRTRIAYVTFAGDAEVKFYLDQYSTERDISNALTITEVGYQTNIGRGIEKTWRDIYRKSRGDRNGVDNVVILLSDGKPTVAPALINIQARRARDSGIEIYTIAVGKNTNKDVLVQVASSPSEHYFEMFSRSDVDNVVSDVLDKICT